ncbi:diaminohydroxyphosphoribosylaminopyrimidine reductase [Halobiforma lacisalsi AJ5]|uniref:2,5-diamino-6-(ribosylamino)-4(3H)-pyrimidinone 5'-phosphate reductase n=1 Tax=Natronobacterium lacisalsi AJ5 TaxID=358396 RepID=M0LHY1_NATLA|nr:2,5-diamino-6-(ribosylamino)-4(3H)-pyrimidinone 5'-phosphate reductase [Halobiforma lacisalsi]APW99480.1 diaminohydroxyphosphoribosylaminopyrimidine reductase [Halobiforma lacisalsi AJ5]EMA31600.1 5-amino-6-(5-phosphoribosylamino)uracil reductase [Halobiforma lacisalsi AJ5]
MHVVVNAAASADGKLSSRRREQIAISGEADFDRVDRLRADSDAVVVGVGTVLADDPSLTVKDAERRKRRQEAGKPGNPARVVVDSRARTPPDAEVADDAATTYVCVSEAAPVDRRLALSERADTELVTAGEERVDLLPAFAALQEEGLEQIMVEGGGELIFSLFEAGLVDELQVFVGPKVIGGRDAPTLADGEGFVEEFPRLALEDVERIDEGILLSWRVEPDATAANDWSEG